MVVQKNESWSDRVREFFGFSTTELQRRAAEDRHGLFFGIRRRMLLFIILLIALGYGISYLKTKKLVEYVVSREKVDLQDESQNKKLAIELALQTAYSQISDELVRGVTINESADHKTPWPKPLTLKPLDPQRGIRQAYLDGLIGSQTLLSDQKELYQHFDVAQLWKLTQPVTPGQPVAAPEKPGQPVAEPGNPAPANAFATLWSRMYWTSGEQDASQGGDRAWIQMLRRRDSPLGGSTPHQYWLVRLDLTPVVKDLVRGTRQLNYFVGANQSAKQLWVTPTGSPDQFDNTDHSDLPPSLESAVTAFDQAYHKNSSIVRRGYLWSGPSQSGVRVAEMFSASEIRRPASLTYSETYEIDSAIIQAISGDRSNVSGKKTRLEEIVELMQRQDPYIAIDPIDLEVGEIRIRAADEEHLELIKLFLLGYVKELVPDAKLKWKDITMDEFVMSVQRVELPTSDENATQQRFLGYLVRSASLEEIRQSVRRDIVWLERATHVAAVFALVAALFVSWRLINPLTRMTDVAEQVSKLGQVKSDRIGPELEQLLAELPTGQGTEIGILSQQFERTTRDLIRAKREAEHAVEAVKSEQRKVEQSGREKAVATEVSEHLVQLLGSVSHDMRQPLVQISTNVERMFKQPDLSPSNKERLGKVLRNTRELDSLIQDILDYNRIIKGDIHLDVTEFDLELLLEEIVAHYRENADQRGVRVILSPWWKGSVTSDRLRLKRVLNNLLSNAINATHDGEVQIVVTAIDSERIEIAVKDTGAGMSQLQQQLIFTFAEERARILRRNRPVMMRKDANSTGLGLHIAKQLIEKMGGAIRFTSVEGKGTTFVLSLPLIAPPQTPASDSPASSDLPTSTRLSTSSAPSEPSRGYSSSSGSASDGAARDNGSLSKPRSMRAVVVDDDPRCTEILAEMLADLGYQSERVHDSQIAVEIITEMLPDLVTLDVIMPEIDGWDVLQQLKQSRLTEEIPVVMVTVHPDESKASLLGASGFVSKPVQEMALHQAIVQAIGSRDNARVLVVDDDPDCLLELEDLLRPLRCQVLSAGDGLEALELLAPTGDDRPPVDLAIVDLYMPRMDGFALIEKLAEMPATRDVPIIVLSAGVLSESERANLLPHVTKFFGKGSVDLATLRQEISRLIRKPSAESTATSLARTHR